MEGWRRNFYVVWLGNFITSVGMMAFLPLFPLHLEELGYHDPSDQQIWSGLLVAAAPFTAALMGPFWGALGDRMGRRPMLLRANAAIVLFVGLMVFAQNPWQLLVLRLLQGLFSGFVAPAMTLVSVAAPLDRQGRVMGLMQTGVVAGSVLGPCVGGLVGDHFGHRNAFLLAAALSLFSAVLIYFLVEETHAPKRSPMGEETPAAMRAASGWVGAVVRDLRALLEAPALRWMLISVFFLRLGAHLPEPNLAIFVQELEGHGDRLIGTATGAGFSATALATLLFLSFWGRLSDRLGAARALFVCALGAALSYLPMGFLHRLDSLYFWRFVSGAMLAGLSPAAYSLAARYSTRENRGGAYGITFSSIGMGNAIAPAIGGFLAAGIGVRNVFLVSALVMALCAAHAFHGMLAGVHSLDRVPESLPAETEGEPPKSPLALD